MDDLKKFIRDVPDFPKPGILFRDITPIMENGAVFARVIDQFRDHYRSRPIDLVAGIEARGFIFGSAIAYALGKGFVILRKKGRLPRKTIDVTYDLEYGTDCIQVHADAIPAGSRVLLIDDLLATGGTAKAACDLIRKMEGKVVECAVLVELAFLEGRKRLGEVGVHSLVTY